MDTYNDFLSSHENEYKSDQDTAYHNASSSADTDQEEIKSGQDAYGGDRLLHYVIDVIVINVALAFGTAFGLLTNDWISTLVFIGCSFIYFFISEYYFGRTVGKLFTHCKVVNQNNEKPTFGQTLLRSIIRFIPLEPLSFVFGANWHDRWSHTKVVKI